VRRETAVAVPLCTVLLRQGVPLSDAAFTEFSISRGSRFPKQTARKQFRAVGNSRQVKVKFD
jgi:hypothetical protein